MKKKYINDEIKANLSHQNAKHECWCWWCIVHIYSFSLRGWFSYNLNIERLFLFSTCTYAICTHTHTHCPREGSRRKRKKKKLTNESAVTSVREKNLLIRFENKKIKKKFAAYALALKATSKWRTDTQFIWKKKEWKNNEAEQQRQRWRQRLWQRCQQNKCSCHNESACNIHAHTTKIHIIA